VMTLTTTAWPDGGQIPAKYTQAGDEASPPLTWSNVPDGVISFVLIVHDLDAAVGNGTDDLMHWMLWNIPGTLRACLSACRGALNCPTGRARSALQVPSTAVPEPPRQARGTITYSNCSP
jgi:phosphatidylethanolamine-binding protein (PEBP) family uncharacterized protein